MKIMMRMTLQRREYLKRVRKSTSSASEMLSFLKDYTQKRDKVEQDKLNMMKEMHEEKKQFFSDFLDVLKKKRDASVNILPVVCVTENQKALNCVVLNYSIPVSE